MATKAELQQLVTNYADWCGIDPRIALAQIERESGWRQDVVYGPFVGGSGERGISQFRPATWARFGSGDHTNAYDPDLAMSAWCAYMGYLKGLFDGDMWSVLAGYNGGEGHIAEGTVSQAANDYASEILTAANAWGDVPVASGNPPGNPPPGATDWKTVGIAIAVVAGLMFAFRR